MLIRKVYQYTYRFSYLKECFYKKVFITPAFIIKSNLNNSLLLLLHHKTALVKVAIGGLAGSLFLKTIADSSISMAAAGASAEEITEKADNLYDQLAFEEIYQLLLPYKDMGNDDVLWRMARALYEKAKATDSTTDKKLFYTEALSLLNEAETINENNFAVHKWLAIIMDCYYTLEGIKSRISHLYEMKTHMERACELKPHDGTSWYVLGMWYFGIANVSWYEKKIASVFFATPPAASYSDALDVFLRAEKVEPEFYSKNYLMIGKCLYYLGRMDEAKDYFLKAKDYPQKTTDDKEANDEAETWLKSL